MTPVPCEEMTCMAGDRHGKEFALCPLLLSNLEKHKCTIESKYLNNQYRQQNYITSIHNLNYS